MRDLKKNNVSMEMDPDIIDAKLRLHLENKGLLDKGQNTLWKVGLSKLNGRGLMATRNIMMDELVYEDAPLLVGPRCLARTLPMCAGCFRVECVLFPCDHGCGLPVCSDECQENPDHRDAECVYLRELEPVCGPSKICVELLPAILPIKALLQRESLRYMVSSFRGHEGAQHGREIDVLIKSVKGQVKEEDEEFMRLICRVMDTNSFETAVIRDDSSTSLRALFPMGALTNHQCVPNTRHHVNERGELLVYATKPILKGDEIVMSYTDLLWDTTMRRQFLQLTKHFSCQCPRCSDITELDSFLGALWCAKDNCTGVLLPLDPLNFGSRWVCDTCGLNIRSKQIMAIRAGITAATEEVVYKDTRKILRFIERELAILVPETSHFLMDMMFRIVSLFGRTKENSWQSLTDDDLKIKIKYCKRLLQCLDKLNCGNCTKKGLILYELYCANLEKSKRILKSNNLGNSLKKKVDSYNEQILYDAMKILQSNIVAPPDYRELYKSRHLIC